MAPPFQVTFDYADLGRLASFWTTALGYTKRSPPAGTATRPKYLAAQGIPEEQWDAFSAVADPEGKGPRLYFQRVPEPRTAKNRVHLNVNVGGGLQTPSEERR